MSDLSKEDIKAFMLLIEKLMGTPPRRLLSSENVNYYLAKAHKVCRGEASVEQSATEMISLLEPDPSPMNLISSKKIREERNWTSEFLSALGTPDKYMLHARVPLRKPYRCWKLDKILSVEASEAFKRRAGNLVEGRLRASTWVRRLKVDVRRDDRVLQKAIDSFNRNNPSVASGQFPKVDEFSDPEHLKRIAVNFIRHEMTDYEANFKKLFGKKGMYQCYLNLKHKVLDAISDAYPEFTDECFKQMDEIRHSRWTKSGSR